jgi:hypothetical protein
VYLYNPAVSKFQSIVMLVWVFQVDLPEPRQLRSDFPESETRQKSRQRVAVFSLFYKRHFGSRLKTHGHSGFSHGSKPPREGIGKLVVTSSSPTLAARDAML